MRLTKLTSTLTILGALFSCSAVAQTRFCIGGDLDHLSQTERSACNAKMQTIERVAASLHAPENWHFVVVCGEEGWKSYTAFALGEEEALMNTSADTHLERRETFLRESRLGLLNEAALQRAMAHEVAGILLHTKDETAIASEADRLLLQKGASAGF